MAADILHLLASYRMPLTRRSIRRGHLGRETAVIAALLLLSGCKEGLDSEPDAGTAARDRWSHNHPANYSYTLTRDCFCLDELVLPVVIEVRGGIVQSRTYAATGTAVDARWESSFPTIDGLFSELDDAETRADRLTVTYERQYGYPQHARIDYSTQVVDDEMDFTITTFTPLP